MDANREYDVLDAHDHGLRLPAQTEAAPAHTEVIPEGVHLPGPSAWPFLAPIGLVFMFLGLVLGPLLIVGGAFMAIAAGIGWYLDANREYEQVEATGTPRSPSPATRSRCSRGGRAHVRGAWAAWSSC